MSGWVKFHRSYFDHWLFSFKEPDKALAWVYLFGKANHKDGELLIKGRVKKVKRGQLAESQLTLQKRFGWSQNKLKRFLQLLEKSEMIEYETDDLTTLITICNYDSFQGSDDEDERPNGRPVERPHERTTDDQSNDKQECNKNKNEKNKEIIDFSILNMSDSELQELKRIRKKNKGGALSQRSVNGLAKEFNKAVLMGYTIDELFTEWETRGWKSFKAEWVQPKNTGGNYGHNQQGHRQLSTIERSTQINRAEYERTQREIAELEAQGDYARIVGGFEY